MFVLTGGTTPALCLKDTLLYASYSVWMSESSHALMLNTYSISNPDTPKVLRVDTVVTDHNILWSGLHTASMTMIDTMIYIATLDSGVYKVNVATLGSYRTIGKATRSNNFPLRMRNQSSHGINKIAISIGNGVWFLNANADEPLVTRAFFLTGEISVSSIVKDNYLIISQNTGGFMILNISNPSNPLQVSALELPRRTELWQEEGGNNLALYGNYLYVQSVTSIEIADISDIKHPFWVGHIPLVYVSNNIHYAAIKVDSCYAYITPL